jgi:hypothetical protein
MSGSEEPAISTAGDVVPPGLAVGDQPIGGDIRWRIDAARHFDHDSLAKGLRRRGNGSRPIGVNLCQMDEWHFIAERKIREAMEEGAFEHLDGTGQPLDLRENPFEDQSLRMAHRLLKNNGFAPSWIEEAKEIERETQLLRAASADMTEAERARRVAAVNKLILNYNLKAPECAQKLLVTG